MTKKKANPKRSNIYISARVHHTHGRAMWLKLCASMWTRSSRSLDLDKIVCGSLDLKMEQIH